MLTIAFLEKGDATMRAEADRRMGRPLRATTSREDIICADIVKDSAANGWFLG